MKNKLKADEKPKKAKKAKKARKGKVSSTFNAMLNGEFLTRKGVITHLPFILFISALFIAYIAIGFQFENTLRETHRLKKELEELTSEYNTSQSALVAKQQQSNVATDIEGLGLEECKDVPYIIEVPAGTLEE